MKSRKVVIVGTGPAALMAASECVKQGASVEIYEKRPSAGRKLLIAGSSGLNISYQAPLDEFLNLMRASSVGRPILETSIRDFDPEAWQKFVHNLGHETFVGTSRRIFVREMKAAPLLQSWIKSLKGAKFFFDHDLVDVSSKKLTFKRSDESRVEVMMDAAILALGGASWEPEMPEWVLMLESRGVEITPLKSSNVGFGVDWAADFIKEADGLYLKNAVLSTKLGQKKGEMVITQYGLEGTPVYFVGQTGSAILDLKPDVELDDWINKLSVRQRENLSPMRRVKKLGGLSDGALAMVFHLSSVETKKDIRALAYFCKNLEIELREPRPLVEAISSSGGVAWGAVNSGLELIKIPRVAVAGEMLDWDAPTGGFLIQACVSTGYRAARTILSLL